MPNRITEGVKKLNQMMANKIAAGEWTDEKLEGHRKALDMDFDEYVRFQNEKSLASMDGRLTADEAQTVYMYLGEIPSTFNDQSFAVKYVLTEVFASLMKKYI